MKCDNCGTEGEEVKETELGDLCNSCYWILYGEHFDIIGDGDGEI